MVRFLRMGACFSLLLWVCACIRDKEEVGSTNLRPGDKLPEFSVQLNDGSVFDSKSRKDKVSVIVFFHTTCPDCQRELPVIQRLYDTYVDNERVAIVCISRGENKDEIETYWDKWNFTIPYSAQTGREIYSLFSYSGIPKVYVSDSLAEIRFVYGDNPVATYDELLDAVEECL